LKCTSCENKSLRVLLWRSIEKKLVRRTHRMCVFEKCFGGGWTPRNNRRHDLSKVISETLRQTLPGTDSSRTVPRGPQPSSSACKICETEATHNRRHDLSKVISEMLGRTLPGTDSSRTVPRGARAVLSWVPDPTITWVPIQEALTDVCSWVPDAGDCRRH
jgi:hypothetical protein